MVGSYRLAALTLVRWDVLCLLVLEAETRRTRSARRDLHFALDLDLDLDLLSEIFKVKVENLTSNISRTLTPVTFTFDLNVVLDDLYQ